MTTQFEFGRLVNRLSAGHALRNVMRWGFMMNTIGFTGNTAQSDAIRRYCLQKLQATEYDDRLRTIAAVREAGFEVIALDTSEFLKSGGSVFCMKLMIP